MKPPCGPDCCTYYVSCPEFFFPKEKELKRRIKDAKRKLKELKKNG